MAELTTRQKIIHNRLKNDFPFYAKRCLKIYDKVGKLKPLILNKAQQHIHEKLEEQLADTGKVRAYILKGRQQGASTYIEARFFHKAAWNAGKAVYILSHEANSTKTLYRKAVTFHDNVPEAVKPEAVTSNKNELVFKNGSRYGLGTAGARNTGRSQTNQYFHGSEVAFYENTDDIQTGALQTVADMAGTEIILESTANGIGNAYHTGCMNALRGIGEYILIFVPWYWQDEYRTQVPPGWVPDEADKELMHVYGLDLEQIYWRHNKILELKSESKFKQEYPFTVAEAFQSSGSSLINADAVAAARKADIRDEQAPIVLGVDPARKGDRTVIIMRQGRTVLHMEKHDEMDTLTLAGILSNIIDRHKVDKCFIDQALGVGTIDILRDRGYQAIVEEVPFGARPIDPIYLNKRAEMALALRDWLDGGEVSIPDSEELEADLLAIPDFKQNSRGLIFLEAKDKIKEIYGKSPDYFDALILTFAAPVRKYQAPSRFKSKNSMGKGQSELSTMSRRRQRSRGSQPGVSW